MQKMLPVACQCTQGDIIESVCMERPFGRSDIYRYEIWKESNLVKEWEEGKETISKLK